MKILFLAANPEGTSELQLRTEVNKIDNSLQKAGVADKFRLVHKWAIDSTTLRRELLDEKPDIVHFSGHGTGKEGLVLVGQDGKPKPAPADALAALFEIVNEISTVRCVLLNACYAEEQAKAIYQHIDNVIGMRHEVKDDAAIAFSTGFYDGLGRSYPIRTAFALGKVAIQFELASFSNTTRQAVLVIDEAEKALEPIPDHLIPILYSREAATPASASGQTETLAEALEEKGVSKQEALRQYRDNVRRLLTDGVLTPTEAFQLSTRATALRLTEIEANQILEEEQQNLAIRTQSFEFKFAKIEVVKKTILKPVEKQDPFSKKVEDILATETSFDVSYRNGKADYFSEKLDESTGLEMVAIPGGIFTMGSPSHQIGRRDSEDLKHLVRVRPFYMGKYVVTEAQWFTVAHLPKFQIDLNPDPSQFKGVNCPVEQVSWYEATEFCDRLSQKTGRQYRLPSEAEWEYACRAGTTTPFHVGETITTGLANYHGNYTYGSGSKGKYREQTTDVGSFAPNEFGLYDMHGNVLEWCLDCWHENYIGAPTDGSAWTTGGDDSERLLRGGSWYGLPAFCRSAYRYGVAPDCSLNDVGFRVVCGGA